LFKKDLSVPEVQLMSGHLNPKILLKTYTKLELRNDILNNNIHTLNPKLISRYEKKNRINII